MMYRISFKNLHIWKGKKYESKTIFENTLNVCIFWRENSKVFITLRSATKWKPEAWSQAVLPDRSLLIGQKSVKNAKLQKFKCDILSNFPTIKIILILNKCSF